MAGGGTCLAARCANLLQAQPVTIVGEIAIRLERCRPAGFQNIVLHRRQIAGCTGSISKRSSVTLAIALPCVEWLHRSEEHTSELQSLMRISYAVFCLKKKK